LRQIVRHSPCRINFLHLPVVHNGLILDKKVLLVRGLQDVSALDLFSSAGIESAYFEGRKLYVLPLGKIVLELVPYSV